MTAEPLASRLRGGSSIASPLPAAPILTIHEYSYRPWMHPQYVMIYVNEHGCDGVLEAVPRKLAEQIIQQSKALNEISNGDGCYGAQAFEYKNIARKALGLKPVGGS